MILNGTTADEIEKEYTTICETLRANFAAALAEASAARHDALKSIKKYDMASIIQRAMYWASQESPTTYVNGFLFARDVYPDSPAAQRLFTSYFYRFYDMAFRPITQEQAKKLDDAREDYENS